MIYSFVKLFHRNGAAFAVYCHSMHCLFHDYLVNLAFLIFHNSGGVLLTVHGQNLDAVQTATLLVNVVKNESPGVVDQQLRSVSKNIITYEMYKRGVAIATVKLLSPALENIHRH